jgi:CDP-4-dehydro-6-deoxyglucose reductase
VTARRFQATVTEVRPLTRDARAVVLQTDAEPPLHYVGGQYVRVHLAGGRRRDLSMANPCAGDNRLELWVRHAGGPFTEHVFGGLEPGEAWDLEGPLGAAGLRYEAEPLLVVAGGTGAGPARALVAEALADQPARRIDVVCGAQTPEDLLAHDDLRDWAAGDARLSYLPTVSRPGPDWPGPMGTPTETVAARYDDLGATVAHVFGPPEMVRAVVRVLRARGMERDAIRADAFTPGAADLDRESGASP